MTTGNMVSEEVKPNGHLGTHVHQESEKIQLKVRNWNSRMVGVDCKTTRPPFPREKGKVGGMGENKQTGMDLTAAFPFSLTLPVSNHESPLLKFGQRVPLS